MIPLDIQESVELVHECCSQHQLKETERLNEMQKQ